MNVSETQLNKTPTLVISIVSHGQGDLVRDLLMDLSQLDFTPIKLLKVIVTLNITEADNLFSDCELPVTVITNEVRKGFGQNHNSALLNENADFFCIINPDVRVPADFSFYNLCETVSRMPGVVAPRVLSSSGEIEDSARDFPTFKKVLKRTAARVLKIRVKPCQITVSSPDWVAGIFMIFDKKSFNCVGGFDESYFMYLEDADICRRLRCVGLSVSYVKEISVEHDARRNTLKSPSHFRWHLASLIRFLWVHHKKK